MFEGRSGRGLAVCLLTGLYALPMAITMHLRLEQFPIKERAPKVALAGQWMILIWPTCEGIRLLLPTSGLDDCKAQWWLLVTVMFFASLTVVYRLTWLVFKIRVMERVKEMQTTLKRGDFLTHKNPEAGSWFVKNRHVMAPGFWVKTLSVLVFLFLVPMLVASLLGGTTCGTEPWFLFSIAWLVLYLVSYLSFLTLLLWLLRGQKDFTDNFHVVTEFKAAMTVTNVIGPPVLLTIVLDWPAAVLTWLITGGILLIFSASCTFPVVLSEINRRKLQKAEAKKEVKKLELQDVLAYEDTYEVFFHFLSKEFSSENALFYRAMDDFKSMQEDFSDGEFVDRAMFLWKEYIQPDSPSQVNISSRQCGQVKQVMSKLTGGEQQLNREEVWQALEAANDEVFKLMQTDSWVRFRADESVMKELTHMQSKASHVRHRPYTSVNGAGSYTNPDGPPASAGASPQASRGPYEIADPYSAADGVEMDLLDSPGNTQRNSPNQDLEVTGLNPGIEIDVLK
eukprot:g9747.t1